MTIIQDKKDIPFSKRKKKFKIQKKNMLNKLFEREQTKEKMFTTVKKVWPQKEGMKPEKIEQIKQQKIKEIEEKYQEYTKEFREALDSGNAQDEQGNQQENPQPNAEESKQNNE